MGILCRPSLINSRAYNAMTIHIIAHTPPMHAGFSVVAINFSTRLQYISVKYTILRWNVFHSVSWSSRETIWVIEQITRWQVLVHGGMCRHANAGRKILRRNLVLRTYMILVACFNVLRQGRDNRHMMPFRSLGG